MAEDAAALFSIFREFEPEAFSLLSGLFLFSSFGLVVTEALLSGLATVPEGAAFEVSLVLFVIPKEKCRVSWE